MERRRRKKNNSLVKFFTRPLDRKEQLHLRNFSPYEARRCTKKEKKKNALVEARNIFLRGKPSRKHVLSVERSNNSSSRPAVLFGQAPARKSAARIIPPPLLIITATIALLQRSFQRTSWLVAQHSRDLVARGNRVCSSFSQSKSQMSLNVIFTLITLRIYKQLVHNRFRLV